MYTSLTDGVFKSVQLNLKLSYYGGYRDTPIDIAESKRLGETAYVESKPFTYQLPISSPTFG